MLIRIFKVLIYLGKFGSVLGGREEVGSVREFSNVKGLVRVHCAPIFSSTVRTKSLECQSPCFYRSPDTNRSVPVCHLRHYFLLGYLLR